MTLGSSMPVICSRCGTVPPGWRGRRPVCEPCQLAGRLDRLLDDGTGTPNPALTPLAQHLLQLPNPKARLTALYKPDQVELLIALATRRIPLTHEALRVWPRQQTA